MTACATSGRTICRRPQEQEGFDAIKEACRETRLTAGKDEKGPAKEAAVNNGMALHLHGRMLAIMKSHGAEEATETQKDFGATALVKMAPRNTAEVLFVQQMIACHEVGLNMLTRAKHTTSSAEVQEAGNLAAKLLGLFERQFTALTKARKPLWSSTSTSICTSPPRAYGG